jgi:hypothetical protein
MVSTDVLPEYSRSLCREIWGQPVIVTNGAQERLAPPSFGASNDGHTLLLHNMGDRDSAIALQQTALRRHQ